MFIRSLFRPTIVWNSSVAAALRNVSCMIANRYSFVEHRSWTTRPLHPFTVYTLIVFGAVVLHSPVAFHPRRLTAILRWTSTTSGNAETVVELLTVGTCPPCPLSSYALLVKRALVINRTSFSIVTLRLIVWSLLLGKNTSKNLPVEQRSFRTASFRPLSVLTEHVVSLICRMRSHGSSTTFHLIIVIFTIIVAITVFA